ncbi:DNA topoisomerase IV subunit A [Alkalicoccus halolimnae]|uniref:DNA topoisomerase 4 subunit A n=1 Tax=Alkalicoccus halolimnae TaxID=1667239 RepID=A0A5C7F9B4_9BACI|nr:DNA topoisomerase IV subunit A [Alkalicoccus halolimnae]TXF87252.1 DNA topoisomerase IV subunit A [Alkalicoccus halolimnae]
MADKERYLDLPLEEVLGDRFGRYSKYIIQDRALPDARDGLKPVQRRILYAMYHDKNTSDKPFRKAAKTIGNVIGNYHPHGDSSVYEAMIRQSQDWKMRMPLVEMHGNNGSVDGDPPAAMRYTEARLASLSEKMLENIDKNTVDFMPNFDDSQEEPVVLPSAFPNLLVNGSTGISSGYATDIPPHAISEVIDAAVEIIDNPDASIDDLMKHIKGPDFPTGGIIQGVEGIKKAYETGKGKVVVRGKAEIESLRGGREQIVITEIPFEINKAALVKKMDELRIDKKVDGLAEVRDETDRTGMRIVIELKKEADAKGVLNFLYKSTDLQTTFNFNMVAIARKTPQLMSLKQLLTAYTEHQKEVIVRRTEYELEKAKDRAHIVEGLIKAISILDEVITVIRSASDKKDAKDKLEERFSFSPQQSEAIVTLQLYRLTNTDVTTLEKEAAELQKNIEGWEALLASDKKLASQMKKELKQVKKEFTDERRTAVEDEIEEIKINLEVVVPSEEVRVSVTKEGYVKRSSLRSYTASNGEDPVMKETDRLLFSSEINTTDTLLLFTKNGSYIYVPVHTLPETKWKESGQHVANVVSVNQEDRIIAALPVKSFKEAEGYLTFVTKNGMIKRTPLSDYEAQRYSKALMAVKLKNNDEVLQVHNTTGSDDVILMTNEGYALRYSETEVSPTGQRTSGMKAINLKDGDSLAASGVWNNVLKEDIYLVTQRAAIKKMSVDKLEAQGRATRGIRILKELKKNPHRIICGGLINKNETVFIQTKDAAVHTFHAQEIRFGDRYTNGSFAIDLDQHGVIKDCWKEL